MRAFPLIRELGRKFPLLMASNLLVLTAESLIGLGAIFAIAPVVDCFLNPDWQHASPMTRRFLDVLRSLGIPATLAGVSAVFILLQVLKSGMSIFARHVLLRTKYLVLRDLMLGTFEDCLRARWLFFTNMHQGTLLNTFFREMSFVGDAFGAVAQFVASLFKCVCYVAAALWLSWQVTLVSLATALGCTLPLLLLGRAGYRLGKVTTATGNRLAIVIQEALGAAKVVLGFGNWDPSLRQLGRVYDEHRHVAVRAQTFMAATPLLYEPLGALVLVVAVVTARGIDLPLAETAMVLMAWRACLPLFSDFASQRTFLVSFLPSYEQVTQLREQARALRQPSGARPFTGLREAIALERVTYAYPGHEPVLSDVSLRIPKGTMVAVVGESGAGKSTLIDLIMAFSEPSAGRLTIDGVPLGAFDVRSYRVRIGYVPQDSILFHASIRDNLLWADEAATEEALREACRLANAEEFIHRFPAGYDTVVGDAGVRLSGGQRQRIALARAILRKPELLILDEATSALDSQSERLIQQAIEAVARETTVVVVAHRLSTIVNADHIYVLRQGRLAEEGTYRELMRKEGLFSHMSQLQVLEAVP